MFNVRLPPSVSEKAKLPDIHPFSHQAPKFSSDSKRVFGLRADAGETVRPMASAVVFTKHSEALLEGSKRITRTPPDFSVVVGIGAFSRFFLELTMAESCATRIASAIPKIPEAQGSPWLDASRSSPSPAHLAPGLPRREWSRPLKRVSSVQFQVFRKKSGQWSGASGQVEAEDRR